MVLNLSTGSIPRNNVGFSITHNPSKSIKTLKSRMISCNFAPALLAAAVIFTAAADLDSSETFSNVPQTLSGDDKKQVRIQRPKSRKAESCTTKCVGTCVRGGGEGPLNVRRPIVVFKQGFRSRQYCLIECSDICNLIKDGDNIDWP